MKSFLPNIDVIVDVETIGIFKHHHKKSANIPLIANGIRNEKAGMKVSKESKQETEKAMIISNAVFNVGVGVISYCIRTGDITYYIGIEVVPYCVGLEVVPYCVVKEEGPYYI